MKRSELLRQLDIGKSVAEADWSLERYFVRTGSFLDFVADRYDIISGDKGTGKSAIFRIVTENRAEYEALRDVELLPAFNVAGQPVFYELTRSAVLTEGEYNSLWKAYILAVTGNYLIEVLGTDGSLGQVEEILELAGLKVGDYRPESVFQRLRSTFMAFLKPKEAEASLSLLENGLPVVSGKIVPDYGREAEEGGSYIPYDYALQLLETALEEVGVVVWVAFDRLDEAFQGAPEHEVPALRALLRAYLDLNHLKRVRLKLFIRNDLFGRVTTGGFVNLTHVNARRLTLEWSSNDLLDLLARRIVDNSAVMEGLNFDTTTIDDQGQQERLLEQIFPTQVDAGPNRPTTWNWILSRIRDSQDVRPPRNLIDLVEFARLSQLRNDERQRTDWEGPPLIEGEAVKQGLRRLSAARVEDTLKAEFPNLQVYFELFRDGKAEQNRESLQALLGGTDKEFQATVDLLVASGFLEKVGDTWKVPMLYRDGLGITQGKGFAVPAGELEQEEDEV